MIHIVEIDPQYHARAWFAFDEADFIRKVQVDHGAQTEMIIHKRTTARQLADEKLGARFGIDTLIYRADYLLGHGIYQTDVVSELRASLAAVASTNEFRIYPDDETAADELDRDPLYKTREGFEAGRKLREQLVEMEVLAEDF